jgi:hypothetical protein
MNTKELMDGDIVLDTKTNKPRRFSVVDWPYVSQYAPLPTSREILEKNEFAYCASTGAFICYAEESYSDQIVSVILFNVESEFRNNQLHICNDATPNDHIIHLMDCNYVHELQHALKVCGIRKEIVL